MKKLFLLLAAVAALAGCKSGKGEAPATRSLILYYSQTGTTKTVAEALQQETGADIEAVEAVKPYDGGYDATIKRCQDEMAAGTIADIKPLKADLQRYDTIYVGYPVWFGTYAPPVATLLKTANFEGKVIVPFCTFGSGGLPETVASIKEALPKSTVLYGFGIRSARIGKLAQELPQYLIDMGIKPGTVAQEPEYSPQKELTATEKAVFEAACGDYPMPLGTPVSVGSCKTKDATKYLFTVTQKRPDGNVGQAKIYVTASDSANVKPEFTLVEREHTPTEQ